MFLNMLTLRDFSFCVSLAKGRAFFIRINFDFTIKTRDETGTL